MLVLSWMLVLALLTLSAWSCDPFPFRCAFERGAEDSRCQFYKNAYESLCPPDWVSIQREFIQPVQLPSKVVTLCRTEAAAGSTQITQPAYVCAHHNVTQFRRNVTAGSSPCCFLVFCLCWCVTKVDEWEELRQNGLWFGKY